MKHAQNLRASSGHGGGPFWDFAMLVDLQHVHQRYIALSNSFKSAWTFHQFLQGLQKAFAEEGPEPYSADFQATYDRLKEISQNLTEATAETAAEALEEIDTDLGRLQEILLAVDRQVSPALLRQFFQRVKSYDDNILTQLVKFYLYSHEAVEWTADRLDKADYLTTKLCEELQDGSELFAVRDHQHLRDMTRGFWTALGAPEVDEADIEAARAEIADVAARAAEIEAIDEVNEQDLVRGYRDLKHDLEGKFFEPRILQAIIETNLSVKNRIHELYRREEQRIVAEYQHVFELEREVPLDVQLSQELNEFRQAVERFEDQLQGSNLRLDELAALREKVRELIPKLKPREEESEGEPIVQPKEVREYLEEAGVAKSGPVTSSTLIVSEEEEISEQQQKIIAALDDTNPTMDPKRVTLETEVFELGLEPREVVAYRRLFGGVTCDRELEDFILRSAALRRRVEEEVEEIRGILDESAVTREAPIYTKARRTTRLGDLYLKRFEHRIEQSVLEGDGGEAKSLQLLKMRLMRSYAGLWLMVHKS